MLNREQQAIIKDIAMKKRMNIEKLLYIFLVGGTRTGKTFIEKSIFQMLIQLYDAHYSTDPLKPKGLIVAYIDKDTYDVDGTIVHSTLRVV